MSVGFNAATLDDVSASSGQTTTLTHNPPGTPTFATVNVTYLNDNNNTADMIIEGITYGGVAMTLVGILTPAPNIEKWVLVSPPQGPATIAITWLDTGFASDNVVAKATATTYTSILPPTYGSVQQATGTTTPITKTLTGVLSDSMLDTAGAVGDGISAFITITVNGTAEVKRTGVTNFGDATSHGRGQHYTSTQTGSGTVTANATESANRPWRIQVLEVKEGTGPPPKTNPGVSTSYSINRFRDGGPEAEERPEVMAAAWRGDRRYQRQGDSVV